jgi:hypothetical protein
VQLDQLWELPFAGNSPLGPEINNDNSTLKLFDCVGQTGMLNYLDLDLFLGKPSGGQKK